MNMLKDIKAAIFDLDGTLVDSMWLWKEIDIEYLKKKGLEFPGDLQTKIEGMSFSETAQYFKERFNLSDSTDDIKNEWNQMAWDYYNTKVQLKSGAKELLDYLKLNNIQIGIATSNSRELVDLVVTRLGVREYFTSIRTSCEVAKGKPSPDIYLLVAKDLDVNPQDCLVFEDVVQGILGGKNAGMEVCAIDDEFSKNHKKDKIRLADYFIDSYLELL